MATGKKMSEYTPFSKLTSEEKATYLGNAAVTTFGVKDNVEGNINVNIPLSTLVPSATDLAGDGLSVNGSTGKLDVSNKVPAPTASTDRGKVLTVNNSDEVVWDTPASSTYVKEDKGLTASGSYIGVDCAGTGGLTTDANGLYIAHSENDIGKFLTVGADNEITWGTPSGGGGGGNPYTKTTVTPGDPYADGQDPWEMALYSQDLEITNNTYSIASKPLGLDSNDSTRGLTNSVKIKLPANTEFPMAVVEFSMYDHESAFTNKVKVLVGTTELTQMYSAPYNDGILVSSESFTTADSYEIQLSASGNTYTAHENYTLSKQKAIGGGTLVQVHIFGNCYRVETNKSTAVGS